MFRLDLRGTLPLEGEDPLPQIVRVIERVALVDHGDPTSMTSLPSLAGELEGVPLDAFHAFARVDVLLDRDLVRGAALELAADAHVGSFGVFPNHHQIDGRGIA